MGKPDNRSIAAEKEFASLAQVLVESANDAAHCLKVLKKNLTEYDSRHGNRFRGTAKSYLRSDIRNAKDVSAELQHVAHKINKSHKCSKKEIASARKHMNATSNALDILKTTARNYDEKHGHATGVKGAIKNAVDGSHDNDINARADYHGDHHHGGILGSSDTVEELVKTTLRNNLNLSVLIYQINTAEKAMSPSIVEKAKEAMHGVKEKLTGDPTRRHSITS
ncbi:uncharacterized protein PITG_16465 [Phytophthora infestans T30-4]|uniref:Uncharacterized protein n=1 Tax=Phytophthora infestans (strain T30-4) TaxID=403677 RepID=D0NTP8_PHYIT|nr:uncharacterized protein PITG_16465 [Phytophthora infestans T30-4]EEY65010.1 conserved hypothetical protein [Phytophthora infestans T30-4]|eukprot:XP_002897498.1 conserved hypothetical protein [Phytophthora infestans T30-4]